MIVDLRQRKIGWIVGGLIAAALVNGGTGAPKFEVRIERKFQSAECCSGYLSINGKPICYVLERPWMDNLPDISSIPPGAYLGFIRVDGEKGWRIELQNVPNRERVQLHIGNTTADSIGCLLPGLELDSSLCKVIDSKRAMKKVQAAFEDQEVASTSSIPISFTIAE